MITISKELLVEAGYKCWSETPLNEPHICRKWQKRITDESGTKYFIDIDETFGWDWINTQSIKSESQKHNFWPSIQFNIKVGEKGWHSVKVDLVQWFNESGQYSGITIQEMEEQCELIWNKLGGQMYE